MVKREAEVLAGVLRIWVTLGDRREVPQKEELAGLPHEPVELERPKTGESIEEERVGMRRKPTIKETHIETIYFNY